MATLTEAKAHLRVTEADFDLEIQGFIDAAVDHLRSIGVDMTATPIPPAIHQATLMLVGHFFDVNRDGTQENDLRTATISINRLVAPYREVSL